MHVCVQKTKRRRKKFFCVFSVSPANEKNPDKKGNMRDYAEVSQLVCLSNLENLNAYLIDNGVSQHERLIELNKAAIRQMKVLAEETLKLPANPDEQ